MSDAEKAAAMQIAAMGGEDAFYENIDLHGWILNNPYAMMKGLRGDNETTWPDDEPKKGRAPDWKNELTA